MKTIPLLFVAALAAGIVHAAAPTPAAAVPAPAPAKGDPDALFALVGRDYKKPLEVPDGFFNPFKIDTTSELVTQQKMAGVTVTNDAVTEAVERLGVSGIVYGQGTAGAARVIIGDQVFRIGDTLEFPDAKGGMNPLIPGANVTLREVAANTLVFDFASETEPARRASFPLHTFWRP